MRKNKVNNEHSEQRDPRTDGCMTLSKKKISMIHNAFLSSPLEQFAIISLIPLHIGNFYFSFTNSSLFMLLTTGFFVLLCYFVTQKGGTLVPSRWQSFVEMIFEFVANLVEEQVGAKGRQYFPLIFTIFAFLLFSNLIGMIPYSFTTTSHLIITFSLSVSVFIAVTIIGFQIHGIHFFSFTSTGSSFRFSPFLGCY